MIELNLTVTQIVKLISYICLLKFIRKDNFYKSLNERFENSINIFDVQFNQNKEIKLKLSIFEAKALLIFIYQMLEIQKDNEIDKELYQRIQKTILKGMTI